MKVTHIFDSSRSSRYPLMISHGLKATPGVHVEFSDNFVSYGILNSPKSNNIEEAMVNSDYIFRINDLHLSNDKRYDDIIHDNNLWNRVVYYDIKDTSDIDTDKYEKVLLYIKRSWTRRFEREVIQHGEKCFPMDFGLLYEYLALGERIPLWERSIDIAVMFPPNPNIGVRRYNLYSSAMELKNEFPKHVIGYSTAGMQIGRRSIYLAPDNNPFIKYLEILRKAKVIFTAYPDLWDGDSRTWEAFSSGALVFCEKSTIPSENPLIDGKHCFFYDARKPEDIKDKLKMAADMIRNKIEHADAIANAGYLHCIKHHTPVARVKNIFRWIELVESGGENPFI